MIDQQPTVLSLSDAAAAKLRDLTKEETNPNIGRGATIRNPASPRPTISPSSDPPRAMRSRTRPAASEATARTNCDRPDTPDWSANE